MPLFENSLVSLLGLTFSNPWLLCWLAAIAIPVLIHLWSRNRYEEFDWAAMRFLRQAVKQNSRRITLQQLLLLAIRVLLLAVLAFSIAAPLIRNHESHTAEPSDQIRTLRVLVVDGSWSMRRRTASGSYWETARVQLQKIVRNASTGDGFLLLQMNEQTETIIRQAAYDREMILREIDALEPSRTVANLPTMLDAVLQAIEDGTDADTRFEHVAVTIISDFEKNTWSVATAANLRRKVERIAQRASISVQPIANLSDIVSENIAVISAGHSPGRVLPDQNCKLFARLQGFGLERESRVSVRMLVDGQQKFSRHVTVSPGQLKSVEFTTRFEFPGDHRVEIVIDDDALTLDNRRFLVVPVQSSIKVLCIGDRPGETENIQWALQPFDGRSASQRFEPGNLRASSSSARIQSLSVSMNSLTDRDLSQYDAIALCNVGSIDSDDARRIFDFVSKGGGLLIFMGQHVRLDNYNRELFEVVRFRLLPGKLTGRSEYRGHLLDPLEYQHPIVSPFRGSPRAGLLSTPIWMYVKMAMGQEPLKNKSRKSEVVDDASNSGNSQIALAFENGDPAIAVRNVGAGRVVCFNSAVSASSSENIEGESQPWSQFHTWPSFVVVVHEMLQHAIRDKTATKQSLVGASLQGTVPVQIEAAKLKLFDPENQQVSVYRMDALKQFGGSTSSQEKAATIPVYGKDFEDRLEEFWQAGPTKTAGFYRLTRDRETPDAYFAVNVDTSESGLNRVNIDSLPDQFRSSRPDSQKRAIAIDNTSYPVYRYLLIGLFCLLLIESCFAGWIGRKAG